MKKMTFPDALMLLLAVTLMFCDGCGEPYKPPEKQLELKNQSPGVKSWSLKTENNRQYGVDDIEIDGKRYLVLHESGRAVGIIPKTETKPEKEP